MYKIKYVLFLVNLIILPLCSFSQNTQKADSLKALLKTSKEDTNKVRLLIEIAEELKFILQDSALFYANNALILAEQTDYFAGKAKAYTTNWHYLRKSGKLQ